MEFIASHAFPGMNDGFFRLSTGKAFHASYGNIIGIDPSLEIFSGSDASLAEEVHLTHEETQELARYMIALWQRVLEAHT